MRRRFPWLRSVAFLGFLAGVLASSPLGAQEPTTTAGSAAADTPTTEGGASTEDGAAPETAGVSRVDLELDRAEITVGDRIRAELILVWMGAEPSAPPRFPTWQETWGDAEVLDSGDIESITDPSGRRIYRQILTLTAFEVGTVDLPSVVFAIPLGDRTEEVRGPEAESFEVVSVLPATDDDTEGANDPAGGATADTPSEELEPRGLAPPVRLGTTQRFLWIATALGLLFGLTAIFLARRLHNLPDGVLGSMLPSRPRLPPFDELVAILDGVDLGAGSEPAHTALSLGLRRFLGRRMRFQAVESTTSEIQRQLRQLPLAGDEVREILQLLRACDQVKFARLEVSDGVTRDRLGRARALGQRIEGHFAPQTPSTFESTTTLGQETAA